ncbi:thermonuclease family protein [Desulfovibrio sp. OttesenSCG-928-O18]|nr:thermonuclease family protein [Desulfovibrio sp. OttesenSCG-928-O18]
MLSTAYAKKRRNPQVRLPWYLRRKLVALLVSAVVMAGGFFFCKGKVLQVVDGDTVVVLNGAGKIEKVRLYGIDCPESRQAGGQEAMTFARDLLLFSSVSLSVVETDQYGRSVAVVRLQDGRLANEELVKAGHAWVYRSYCKEAICASWYAYERRAKKQSLGLWNRKNPTPPWQWRRANPRR